ncbi:IS110 family transposase, partial [Natronococcus jeotgali]|uniref:IS110 family transposase n=1 Tax=Natronococcus jeotgali TaxID=413812 RepID=UPI0012683C74
VDEFRLSHGTERAELEEFAREYAGSAVAIGATGHYRPIYETLDEHTDVTLVNPSKTRVIADAKVKTDRVDAKMLAHLLRANLVAESYVPPKDVRERRDLV